MAMLKCRFLGTVDADVDPKGIQKKKPDGSLGWGGRIANVSGKLYVGSLMLDAISNDGSYPDKLDPPLANEDFCELHGVALIASFEEGRDTDMSAALVGLKAGDRVVFAASLVIEAADRGMTANLRPTEPLQVLQRAPAGATRKSRLAGLVELNHVNGK